MYLLDRSNPVIVQVRDALEEGIFVATPSGTVSFADPPHDGAVITISDGVAAIAYRFKDVPAAVNDVLIGTTAATMTAFIIAVNANAPADAIDRARGIVAVALSATSCELLNTCSGSIGNVAITVTVHADHITVTGMSDTVELTSALPNNTTKTIPLNRLCRLLILTLPSGAICNFSTQATATAASLALDGTMIRTVRIPSGTRNLYVVTSSDMSTYLISIEGH